jgi:hypothetical protein
VELADLAELPVCLRLRLPPGLTIATACPGNYLVHIGAKKPHVKSWKLPMPVRERSATTVRPVPGAGA